MLDLLTLMKHVLECLGWAGGQHLPDGPGGLGAGDELRHLAYRLGQLAAVVLKRGGLLLRYRKKVDHRFSRMRAWNSRSKGIKLQANYSEQVFSTLIIK